MAEYKSILCIGLVLLVEILTSNFMFPVIFVLTQDKIHNKIKT